MLDLNDLIDDKPGELWGGYPKDAWEKPSMAVIANRLGHGAVLWTAGPHLRMELEEIGLSELDELGLGDAPFGISIWEGKVVYNTFHGLDGPQCETETVGTFRRPTPVEWLALVANVCPWSELDWGLPAEEVCPSCDRSPSHYEDQLCHGCHDVAVKASQKP